jgi:hypothetical protein
LAKDPEPEKTLEELASAYQAQGKLVATFNERIADANYRIREAERSRDASLATMNKLKREMAERLELLPKSKGLTSAREMSDGELREIDARMAATTKAIEDQ